MILDCNYFCKKIHFRLVTSSEFASDYNKSNVFYERQKSYITIFGTVILTTGVGIRSHSGPYFCAFGLNTDQNIFEYGHFLGSASLDFVCSKSTTGTLKTLEQNVNCV